MKQTCDLCVFMVGEGFGNQRQLDPGLKPFIRICQSFVREVDRCSGIR